MLQICLIFVGLTLFLNGFLPLINENDNNETAIMNVLTGFLLAILSIFGIVGNTDTTMNIYYVSILLFSFTCFYNAAVSIWDLSESSFGWMCGASSLLTIAIGIYYILNAQLFLGILWIVWTAYWAFNFLSCALGVLRTTKYYVLIFIGSISMGVISMLSLCGILMF